MRKRLIKTIGILLLPAFLGMFFLTFIIFWIGTYNTRMGALLILKWCTFYENTLGYLANPDKSSDTVALTRLTAYLQLGTDDPQIWKCVKLTTPKDWNWAFVQCFGYFLLQRKYQLAETVTGDWIRQIQTILSEKNDDFHTFVEKYGDDFSTGGQSITLDKTRLESQEEIKGYWAWMRSLDDSQKEVSPYFDYYHACMAQGIARWLLTQNPEHNKPLQRLIRERITVGFGGIIYAYIDKSLALRLGMSEEEVEELHRSIVRRPAEAI